MAVPGISRSDSRALTLGHSAEVVRALRELIADLQALALALDGARPSARVLLERACAAELARVVAECRARGIDPESVLEADRARGVDAPATAGAMARGPGGRFGSIGRRAPRVDD